MARIIGDYIGTTWDDFLVLPDWHGGRAFTPEDVDISVDLGGVGLRMPFLPAAMRSITGEELGLEAGMLGAMGVAPRGLTIDRQVGIVRNVKKNAVKVGGIESEKDPTTISYDSRLGQAVEEARKTGHTHIPVVTKRQEFMGMFNYRPSKHDNMDPSMPLADAMVPYRSRSGRLHACSSRMGNLRIKDYMKRHDLRFVPVVDGYGRLDRLVFMQTFEAYKIGAAIDTHSGWEGRAEAMINAGADMIFIDTSDGDKPFAWNLVRKYYKTFGDDAPPICGGNVVTPEAFHRMADAGARVVKIGMGPGSICTTNEVLGVGAPPFWSLVEVAKARDEYASRPGGEYIPVIADGGIERTDNMNVAMTHADAIMGGKMFGCFFESEGDRVDIEHKMYSKHEHLPEDRTRWIKIFGEGSREARHTTGDMKRYSPPTAKNGVTTFQGVSGLVPYRGRFKPGVEGYADTLREALYHTGSRDLAAYRNDASLIRMSDRAKRTAAPHGIEVIE